MADAPKRIKRLLREYAAAAHEEELRRALLPVSEGFKRWERRSLAVASISLEPCGSMRKIKRRDDVGLEVVLRLRLALFHLTAPAR